ncbi:MAG: DUF4080 domain-containing protein [Clostridiaceae bacterium]|nr:DUF4080 domain-containing protein [Clostridiaceae bacterium]
MKTLLVAVNAKYEHEGLAVWYLKAACKEKDIPVIVRQYSINDSMQRIWSSILEVNPDVVAFSCYIWNRRFILDLVDDLKKARPQTVIIIGGPETSYEESEKDYYSAGADLIIKGEGENKLPLVLEALKTEGLNVAKSLIDEKNICMDYSEYISPFCSEYLERIKDRIAYIESSRGCPYRCSYCLSSESKKLKLFPLDKVEKDIEALVKAGAKVIKFVDRSFNINEEHSLRVWKFIRKFQDQNVTFHFEVNPDRLTDAQMSTLLNMPKGLVQIEAGIQSVNTETLKSVSRVMNVDIAIENLKILANQGNVHVHTDLIAGLPYENIDSFINSFNRVYEVNAHHLQLGFLKLIHGTRIRREADLHGYKYRAYPPYEIIENRYLTSNDILRLKRVEEVLDRTYNSGRFILTLKYLLNYFSTPFELYESFSDYLADKGMLFMPISAVRLFKTLREFALGIPSIDDFALDSYIALDYASSLKNTVLPDFLKDSKLKVLDGRDYLDSYIEGGWKKGYQKSFMLLSGRFPEKKGEDFKDQCNTMLVDMTFIDPVTNRALIKSFQ